MGPNSICVEDADRSTSILTSCVVHHCVQIEGTELVALALIINSKQQPIKNLPMHKSVADQTEWCYTGGTVHNGQLQCPPLKYACARSTIHMLSPTDDPIPPPCEQ